ncbi:Na(+) H(+) antiporter subunit F [hydrothermal vent metagenome]|uniref:Na(+) H(+) antiporter subunit F n=1 Tax=hydrothermal vent metagenome TaxID=652676 RepID=A0A3B0V4N3_9ZZZZ
MTLEGIIIYAILPLLTLAGIFTFIRLAQGPTLPGRAMALDLMTTIGIGMITVYAILTQQPVILDVAIVLALLAFLGTVAFAYYVERSR